MTETAVATETTKSEKPEIDITEFTQVLEGYEQVALDPTQGPVYLAELVKAYSAGDRAQKAAARTLCEKIFYNIVMSGGSNELAQKIGVLKDYLVQNATPSANTAPKPKDLNQAAVERTTALLMAYSISVQDAQQSPDVTANVQERAAEAATPESLGRVAEYVRWLESDLSGDAPKASPLERVAARLSLGRSAKGQGRKPGSKTASAPATAPVAEAPTAPGPASAPAGAGTEVPAQPVAEAVASV